MKLSKFLFVIFVFVILVFVLVSGCSQQAAQKKDKEDNQEQSDYHEKNIQSGTQSTIGDETSSFA